MADLPGSFEEALRALALWFESDEVPYTTVGGMAVSLLGQPRATQDIDVVVWLGERPWDSFVSAAEGRGDLNDIEALLRVNEKLDLNRIRYWAGEFAAALETPGVLDNLERMLARRPSK